MVVTWWIVAFLPSGMMKHMPGHMNARGLIEANITKYSRIQRC